MKTGKQRGSGRGREVRGRAGLGRTRVLREIAPKRELPVLPPPKDVFEARKSISDEVRGSSLEIVNGLIRAAAKGEVGPAKYLFEMVGLYPATEETSSKPEDSLAFTLLQRMGLPPLEEDGAEKSVGGK